MNGYKIIDRRTGLRIGISHFLTEDNAKQQITEWQNRHDNGGRPDITRELLLNMTPAPMP